MLGIKEIVNWLVMDRFKKDRIETIQDVLMYSDINYKLQYEEDSRNIIITLGDSSKPKLVIGAHYDIFGTSMVLLFTNKSNYEL